MLIRAFFNLSFFMSFRITQTLRVIGDIRQNIYNRVTLKLLNVVFLKDLILLYHLFLFYFRYLLVKLFTRLETYINLHTLAIIVSVICSRLHVAGYMIIICLLLIRLDFSVLSMTRFYKNHPGLLGRNFPQTIPPHTRGMWWNSC